MNNRTILGAVVCLVVGAPVMAQTLKQTPFEDGTGSIGLPPDWKITSVYRGSVTCVGPNDCGLALKIPFVIVRPDSSTLSLPDTHKLPIAWANDLATALREVLKKNAGATLKTVRASRTADVSPGVPAYYLLYTFEQKGKSFTGLGYFAPLDYGPSSPTWQLYSSAVFAPSDQFPKVVRTMLQMWQSWRPNGRPPQEGSSSAIFDKIIKERIEKFDQIQKMFREQL